VAKDVAHASRDVAKDIGKVTARVFSGAAPENCPPGQAKKDRC
jgi:hypothetical protein